MQKESSSPSMLSAVFLRIILQREVVNLRLSLHCRGDIKFENSFLYSPNLTKKYDSLSIPIASAVKHKAMTPQSENLGTTPERSRFLNSLPKFPAIYLQMSIDFAIFAYKLYR